MLLEEGNYRFSMKMAESVCWMILVMLGRVQKAYIGHGFSAEGPLPEIMIQLLVGMGDLGSNLMGEVLLYLV